MDKEIQDWGHWTPPDSIKEVPKDAMSFVYKITDSNGKFYIGCKLLFKTIKRPPLKGKKRKRISVVDSDWRNYCSSSGVISEDVKTNKHLFKFEILSFHESKTTLRIEEARLIIENIWNLECHNQMVNLRIRVPK
jgi:hypothetical protein